MRRRVAILDRTLAELTRRRRATVMLSALAVLGIACSPTEVAPIAEVVTRSEVMVTPSARDSAVDSLQTVPTAPPKSALAASSTSTPAPAADGTVTASSPTPTKESSSTSTPAPAVEGNSPAAVPEASPLPADDGYEVADAPEPLDAEAVAETVAAIYRELNPTGPKDVDTSEFFQLIEPDDISPIYSPSIGLPAEVDLEDDDLVMGVSLGGEARAYPIRVLRSREMVNDELGGAPILVTW